MPDQKKEEDRALDQAGAQRASIVEMVKRLKHAQEGECTDEECRLSTSNDENDAAAILEYHNEDAAREAIQEDPLEVCVRSDWHAPNVNNATEPDEYFILLCTGGPAVRLIGELDEHAQPCSARLEYQDWGTRWTRFYDTNSDDDAALLTYAQEFYYGE